MRIGIVLPSHLEFGAIHRTLETLQQIAIKSELQFHVVSQNQIETDLFPNLFVTQISEEDLRSLKFVDFFGPEDYIEILTTAVAFKESAFAQYENLSNNLPSVQMHYDAEYKHPLARHVKARRTMTVNDDDAIWTGAYPLIIKAAVLMENRELPLLDHSVLYSFCLVTFGRIRLIPNSIIMSEENPDHLYLDEFKQDWYLGFANRWREIFRFYNGCYHGIPVTIQKSFLYLLERRILINVNTKHKQVLNREQVEQFFEILGESLRSISDELILRGNDVLQRLNRSTRIYLQKLKYSKDAPLTYQRVGNDVLARSNYTTISSLSGTRVAIDSMSFYEGRLEIAGFFPAYIDHENLDLYLELSSGERVLLEDKERYSEFQIFGVSIHRHPTFVAALTTEQISQAKWIRFTSLDQNSGLVSVHDLKFRKPMSKLTTRNRSYWDLGDVLARYEDRKIYLEASTAKTVLLAELRFMFSLIKNRERFAFQAVMLRIAYWLTKPVLSKRRIWIYSDKVYKAGDNGEYAYTYATKQKDGIDKYYVLRPDSPDAARFHREKKKYLKFGTLKHKILFLNAEIVYATHTVLPLQHGLKDVERHLRGLFVYNTVFLQHGLSVQRLPWILNKYVDNTRMYCLASEFEKQNLLLPEAGYASEDLVSTGVARYDGLISNPKKIILVTPTWRTYLAPPARFGSSRPKSEQFLRSDYFLLYTELLQNEKLLSATKAHGYSIKFLLHPVISAHAEDFQEALPGVEVLAATDGVSYEEILTEANIMLTDYSGVQFDFAYMNKPVVYYHPDTLPPSYEEGVYSYAKDALGRVFGNEISVVEELCRLMENGNMVEPEVSARIQNFFYQQDQNNAKRIYEAVMSRDFKRQ